MCPLPREARKLLEVPLLATQAIYQYFEALNWGERLKKANNGWGGGGGGGEGEGVPGSAWVTLELINCVS